MGFRELSSFRALDGFKDPRACVSPCVLLIRVSVSGFVRGAEGGGPTSEDS